MLSQQQLRDNAPLFNSISEDEARQICSVVLDSLQYQTNLSTQLAGLEISDPGTRQALSDTILSFVQRLLQSRASSSDCGALLEGLGVAAGHAAAVGAVIASRLDAVAKDLASRSSGDKLVDLEWRFGLTAASNSGAGAPFVQMRVSFEKLSPVSVEMGMLEFYEFAADIKKIQQQISTTLGI
jgi:hypothetical protein